jgi:hypothetical protein
MKSSIEADTGVPTGTPRSRLFGAKKFTQVMPRLLLQTPIPLTPLASLDGGGSSMPRSRRDRLNGRASASRTPPTSPTQGAIGAAHETWLSGGACATGAGRLRAAVAADAWVQELLFARWRPGRADHHQCLIARMRRLHSNVSASDWVRSNVLYFTKGLPEVMVGNVLIAEVKPESPDADPPDSPAQPSE